MFIKLIPLLFLSLAPNVSDHEVLTIHGRCALIEINNIVNPSGSITTQIIFWGYNGRIRDWCYWNDDFFEIEKSSISWEANRKRYKVHASDIVSTCTYFDPELKDRKRLPASERVPVFKSPLRVKPWVRVEEKSPFCGENFD